jgi:hypothetical protein
MAVPPFTHAGLPVFWQVSHWIWCNQEPAIRILLLLQNSPYP